ncbi:MAG: hypothetical protein AB1728_08800 [Bacteroidota bacterium]
MTHNTLKDEMHYYLNNGIVQDICQARQSYALLMTVGKNGPKLGASVYVDFFQSLQTILTDHFVIHVTKLFERPNSRYDTISIPSILKFIEENADGLDVLQPSLASQHLYSLGLMNLNPLIDNTNDVTKVILEYFNTQLFLMESSPAYQRLKVLRDKRVAHREAIDISNSPEASFADTFELLKFAQNFAIVVGAAYTSNIYGFINDQFYLGEDMEKSSISLSKVFSVLLN